MTTSLLEHTFPAETDQLERMRARVRKALTSHGCDHEFVESSVLAVDEAVSNVVRHGYRDGARGTLRLSIQIDGPELAFVLHDDAKPFDSSKLAIPSPGELRAGGYGRFLMHTLMDSIRYQTPVDGVGNLLEMRRRWPPPAQDQRDQQD